MANMISYVGNIGKSVSYSAIDKIKAMNPAITAFADTNSDFTKSVYNSIKSIKMKSTPMDSLKSNKMNEMTETLKNNIFEDLKSGKFYNKERIKTAEEKSLNDMMGGDFGFGDEDFNFDDALKSLDDMNSNEMMDVVGEKTSLAISSTVAKSSEYIVNASKANTKMMYDQMNSIYGGLHAGMSNINSNIVSLLEYQKQSQTHYQNSRTYFETSTSLDKERNAILKEMLDLQKSIYKPEKVTSKSSKVSYDDIISQGIPDLQKYMKSVKQNIDEMFMLDTIKSVGSMANDMGAFDSMIASPLKTVTDAMVNKLMPNIIESSLKSFNNTLSGMFSSTMMKLNASKDDYSKPVMQMIANIFGVDTNLKTKLDSSKYEKGPVPFDGITRKSIVEVIPTYLSKILAAVSDGKETRYDYKNGKFVTIEQVRRELKDITKQNAKSASYDVNEYARDYKRNIKFKTKADEDQFDQDLEEILTQQYKDAKLFMHRSKNVNAATYGLKGGKKSDINMALIKQMFEQMPRGTVLGTANEIFDKRATQSKHMREREEDGSDVLMNLFNGSIAEEKSESESDRKKQKVISVKTGNAVVDLLDDIHKEISYIRAYGVPNNNPSSSKRAKGGSSARRNVRPDFKSFKNINSVSAKSKNQLESTSNVDPYYAYNYDTAFEYDENLTPEENAELLKTSINEKKKLESNSNKKQSFLSKMANSARLSDKFKTIIDNVDEISTKPAKFLASIIQSADNRMYDLIYGPKDDMSGDRSLVKNLFKGLKNTFGTFNDWMNDHLFAPLSEKLTKENIHNTAKNFFGNVLGIDLDKTTKDIREFLFGKKFDNGIREKNGIFGGFVDGVKQDLSGVTKYITNAFKEVGNWFNIFGTKNEKGKDKERRNSEVNTLQKMFNKSRREGMGKTEDIGNAASGIKKVTKTGVIAVSDGEMIIPPDLNPYNIKNRLTKENRAKKKFMSTSVGKKFGNIKNYALGGNVTIDDINGMIMDDQDFNRLSKKQKQDIADAILKNKKLQDEINSYAKSDPNGLGAKYSDIIRSAKQGYTKDDYIGGEESLFMKMKSEASTLGKNIIGGSKNIYGDIKDRVHSTAANANVSEEFKTMTNDVMENLKKYAPDMFTGGAIGAGVSLLTGAIGGPILGAAAGSAIGLIKKSETVQNWLFGEIGEDGQRQGGIISKSISNNIEKYFPNMAKGATLGGITSILPFVPGGPVSGIILGSAIGFASKNEKIQEALFGEDGMMKDMPAKVKHALPKMGLGAAAGLVAGPFGLATNLILGAGAGFAADTDTFKKLMFGEEDLDGKRQGGIFSVIKDYAIMPATDFMKKTFEDLSSWFNKDIKSPVSRAIDPITKQIQLGITGIGKFFKNKLENWWDNHVAKGFENFLKNRIFNPVGKMLSKVTNFTLKPVKAIASAPFKAIGAVGDHYRKKHIKQGNATYMSAAERMQYRADEKFGRAGVLGNIKNRIFNRGEGSYDDQFVSSDEVLAGMSADDLTSLKQNMAYAMDTETAAKKSIRSSRKNMYDALYDVSGGKEFGNYRKAANTVVKMVKKGNYEGAIKFINSVNVSEEEKERLRKVISTEGAKIEEAERLKSDTTGTKNKMYSAMRDMGFSNLSEKNISKYYDYVNSELSYRNKDKKSKVVTPEELINDGAKKRHQEIVNYFQETVSLLRKIAQPTGEDLESVLGHRKNRADDLFDIDEEYQSRRSKVKNFVTGNRASMGVKSFARNTAASAKGKASNMKHNAHEKMMTSGAYYKMKTGKFGRFDPLLYRMAYGNTGEKYAPNFTMQGSPYDPEESSTVDTGSLLTDNAQGNIDDPTVNKSIASKLKNSFESAKSKTMKSKIVTTFYNGHPIQLFQEKNGSMEINKSDANTRETLALQEDDRTTQKGILTRIGDLGSKFTGLFSKGDKDDDEKKDKKDSIFSSIFTTLKDKLSGIGKVLTGLAGGSAIIAALPALGNLYTNTLKPFFNENVKPVLIGAYDKFKEWGKETFLPKLQEGATMVKNFFTGEGPGSFTYLFQEKIIPTFMDGFQYFMGNVAPKMAEILVTSLPSIMNGVLKGIGGLGRGIVNSILGKDDADDINNACENITDTADSVTIKGINGLKKPSGYIENGDWKTNPISTKLFDGSLKGSSGSGNSFKGSDGSSVSISPVNEPTVGQPLASLVPNEQQTLLNGTSSSNNTGVEYSSTGVIKNQTSTPVNTLPGSSKLNYQNALQNKSNLLNNSQVNKFTSGKANTETAKPFTPDMLKSLPIAFTNANYPVAKKYYPNYLKQKDQKFEIEDGTTTKMMTLEEILNSDQEVGRVHNKYTGEDIVIIGKELLNYPTIAEAFGIDVNLSETEREEENKRLGIDHDTNIADVLISTTIKNFLSGGKGSKALGAVIKGTGKLISVVTPTKPLKGLVKGSSKLIAKGVELTGNLGKKVLPGVLTGLTSEEKLAKKVAKGAKNKAADVVTGKFGKKAAQEAAETGLSAITNGSTKISQTAINKALEGSNKGVISRFISSLKTKLTEFFSSSTIVKAVKDAVMKMAGGAKNKITDNLITKTIKTLIEKIVKKVEESALKNVVSVVAKIGAAVGTAGLFSIAQAIIGFTSGFNNANTIIGVTEQPNIGIRMICGIVQALNEVFLMGLVPVDLIFNLIYSLFKTTFGWEDSDFDKQRKESQNELGEYNRVHGTSYDLEDYNDKDKLSFKVKQGFGNVVEGAKNFGQGILDGGKKVLNFFTGNDDEEDKKETTKSDKNKSGSGTLIDLTPTKLKRNVTSSEATMYRTIDGFMSNMSKGLPLSLDSIDQKMGSALGLEDKKGNPLSVTASTSSDFKKTTSYWKDKLSENWNTFLDKGSKNWNNINNTTDKVFTSIKKSLPRALDSLNYNLGAFLGMTDKNGKPISLTEANNQNRKQTNWFPGLVNEEKPTTTTPNFGTGLGLGAGGSGVKSDVGNTGSNTFVSQLDPKYANKKFNNSSDSSSQTLGDTGCGPAAATMVVNDLTGKKRLEMNSASNLALKYKVKNGGVTADYFQDVFNQNGIQSSYITDNNVEKRSQKILANLAKGNKVILMGQDPNNQSKKYSPYGSNPHYVVANAISNDGKYIYINDPESNRPNRKYSTASILGSSKLGIAATSKVVAQKNPKLIDRFKPNTKVLKRYSGRATDTATIEKKVWKALRGAGYNEYAVAGAMGNIYAESHFDPAIVEGGTGWGFGLCQWTNPNGGASGRRSQLETYAATRGKSPNDVDIQIEFMIKELTPGVSDPNVSYQLMSTNYEGTTWSPNQWKTAADLTTATKAFCYTFERPNASQTNMGTRLEAAKKYYQQYTGTPGAALTDLSDTGSVDDTNTTDTSSTQSTSWIDKIYSIFDSLASSFNVGGESIFGQILSGNSGETSSNDTTSLGGTSGGVSKNSTNAQKQKALVNKFLSYQGKLSYSQPNRYNIPEDPNKGGSADCSSLAQYAYKNVLGVDPGSWTGAQENDADTYTVDSTSGGPKESNLQLGDLLLFNRGGVGSGHVEMYIGNGQMAGHGGPGSGPNVHNLMGDASRFMMAKRWVGFKDGGSGSGLLGLGKQNNKSSFNKIYESPDNDILKRYQASGSGLIRPAKRKIFDYSKLGAQGGNTPTEAKNNTPVDTATVSNTSNDMYELVKSILHVLVKIVTNSDNLNTIVKLLTQIVTNSATASDTQSKATKANLDLTKANLMKTLNDSTSTSDDKELLNMIKEIEKLTRE